MEGMISRRLELMAIGNPSHRQWAELMQVEADLYTLTKDPQYLQGYEWRSKRIHV